MWPRDPHARLLGEAPEPPGGGMAAYACAAIVKQDRAGPRAPTARSMARPTAGGSGTKTTLLPLPQTYSIR